MGVDTFLIFYTFGFKSAATAALSIVNSKELFEDFISTPFSVSYYSTSLIVVACEVVILETGIDVS